MPFRELGYRQPDLESAIRLNHRLASWAALEVLPVRRLGLSAIERRFGVEPSVPETAALAHTWLARRPEPWTVEGHIGYDITHTVFHLTDWGEKPAGLPADIAEYLALWLPVWLDDWLDLKRWDLLGELLVVDACLPEPTLDPAAWAGFAQAQEPDGAMPVVGGMPEGDESRCSTWSTTRRWSPRSPPRWRCPARCPTCPLPRPRHDRGDGGSRRPPPSPRRPPPAPWRRPRGPSTRPTWCSRSAGTGCARSTPAGAPSRARSPAS